MPAYQQGMYIINSTKVQWEGGGKWQSSTSFVFIYI